MHYRREESYSSYTLGHADFGEADYDGMMGTTDTTIKMKKHTYFPEDSDRDDFAR